MGQVEYKRGMLYNEETQENHRYSGECNGLTEEWQKNEKTDL